MIRRVAQETARRALDRARRRQADQAQPRRSGQAIAEGGGGGDFLPRRKVSFGSPGETSWTVPGGVTQVLIGVLAGGGGGGGGNSATDSIDDDNDDSMSFESNAGGGSGGAGGFTLAFVELEPGEELVITVGAGGAGGGAAGADGEDGEASSVKDAATGGANLEMSAPFGGGGRGATGARAGVGGDGSEHGSASGEWVLWSQGIGGQWGRPGGHVVFPEGFASMDGPANGGAEVRPTTAMGVGGSNDGTGGRGGVGTRAIGPSPGQAGGPGVVVIWY